MIKQSYTPFSIDVVVGEHTVSKACNLGASKSCGEYLLFLGADDMLAEEYISECIKLMKKGVGFVQSGCQYFGAQDGVSNPTPLRFRWSGLLGFGGQIGASLIRREAFDDVCGFDESLVGCEDSDLLIRMMFKGWRGACVKEPLHFYRRYEGWKNRHNSFVDSLRGKYPVVVPLMFMSNCFRFVKRRVNDVASFVR